MKIEKTLDSFFEINGLLYMSNHWTFAKKELIKHLDETGIKGDAYFSKHLKILNKYIQIFTKEMIKNDDFDFFFGEYNDDFHNFLSAIIIGNKENLEKGLPLDNDKGRQVLNDSFEGAFAYSPTSVNLKKTESIINFLDSTELVEDLKWKMLHLFSNYSGSIAKLFRLLNLNKNAYENAVEAIKVPLKKAIDFYVEKVSKPSKDNPMFYSYLETFSNLYSEQTLYPTLIATGAFAAFEHQCYCGLFAYDIIKKANDKEQSNDLILMRLKALADPSKLKILLSLKEKPKYNLELAQELDLSAATVSHHMNVLLNCYLVLVTKKQGKVYYALEKATIKELTQDLERILL